MEKIEDLERKAEYLRDLNLLEIMNGDKGQEQQNLFYFFKGLARGLEVAERVKGGFKAEIKEKGGIKMR